MTARVVAGLTAVQVVAARPDPTAPLAAGAIARALGMPLPSVSRLCAELVETGMLERAPAYGSYRLGAAAVALSGRAQHPYIRTIRAALLRVMQETGETAFVAAPASCGLQVTVAVTSPWTLYSPAIVGEVIDDTASAIVRAADRFSDGRPVAESTRGKCVELAVPILEPGGASVAVVAVRLPVNRAKQGVANARRALAVARRAIERRVDAVAPPLEPVRVEPGATALAASVALLQTLAAAEATVSDLAAATGLRRDRAQRLLESCVTAGLVTTSADGERVRLAWTVHGWLRAAAAPLLVAEGADLVARAADDTGACAFLTVLRGMRSVTVVEELRDQGEGLEMTPWLGRPCPITSADGGPVLLSDFPDADVLDFLPKRTDPRESADFLERVREVTARGVVAKESFEEAGQTAVTAPVRDASGTVVAAACLVGSTDLVKPRIPELVVVARELAAEVSRRLGAA